jgi:hypothetical protein
MESETLERIIEYIPFKGDDGLLYYNVTKELKHPRKTFIKGDATGKYRGQICDYSDDYIKKEFYDFEIYEAVVENGITKKNSPYHSYSDKEFPREKLPGFISITIQQFGKSFGINILEPRLFNFQSVKKLHQVEDKEVFGTFNAVITGHIFDYEVEIVNEVVGPFVDPDTEHKCQSNGIKTGNVEYKEKKRRYEYHCKFHPDTVWGKWEDISAKKCESNGVKTGLVDKDGDYTRYQYHCKHHPDNVWGPWIKKPVTDDSVTTGCFSSLIGIIGTILLFAFLIAILPGLGYILGFFAIILLLNLFAPFFKWIFRIVAVIFIISFLASLINSFVTSTGRDSSPPVFVDNPRETQESSDPIVDVDSPENIIPEETKPTDYWITRYREWKDYDGNHYNGYYKIKQSDVAKASQYKKNLSMPQSTPRNYDRIIHSLKENDKNKLDGLYHLFDSIQQERNLSKVKFAEMVVSFVQDIPYVLILDKGCNPGLYNDNFVRRYLSDPNAKCAGHQKFGINTPLEFLRNLEGDCDTRTILLYTILSHYDYDVAVMSSEFYGHSILGLNIPINGLAYKYQTQRYILWETTAPNIRPGRLPNEISNLNNWRISLKSK